MTSVNGNPLARRGKACGCTVPAGWLQPPLLRSFFLDAGAESSGGQRLPQTCLLPHAAVGPMALRYLFKGFVKGDPKGWTALRAAEGLLPSLNFGASMDSMGS